jgi:hypothetical protein
MMIVNNGLPMKTPRHLVLGFAVLFAGIVPALAQSTDQQIDQMEQKLDMNATPDMAALAFQNDLASVLHCQSNCRPLINSMLSKYKSKALAGGNAELGASDAEQLAGAVGYAAATLPKAEADEVAKTVAADLGPDAANAYKVSYDGAIAPYAPQ